MTDPICLNNQAPIGISSDCQYNLKTSSVRGRSYRGSIATSNKSTFAPQDTAILYIPCGRVGTFLDTNQTYLRFTVENTDSSDNFFVDNIASSFIERIDIFHGSNQIESIQGYNVLMSFLKDFQLNASESYGLSNVYGTSYEASPIDNRKGLLVAKGQKATFCIPLLCCMGILSDKMIPIGQCYSDIRIEITWASNKEAVCWEVAGPYDGAFKIDDCQLELQIVELSDEGMAMVESNTPFSQPVFMHSNSWRHYSSTLPATNVGMYSTLVPARFASLRGLVLCPRRALEMADFAAYSTSSRVNPCIQDYCFRIGSSIIPQRHVQLWNASNTGGCGEAFCEIQKFFHGFNHPEMSSSLAYSQYNVTDLATAIATIGGIAEAGLPVLSSSSLAATSYKNAFAIAQELELFANREGILSGLSTLSSQTFFEATIGFGTTNQGPQCAYTLDFFANFDQILVLQNGLLSVRF